MEKWSKTPHVLNLGTNIGQHENIISPFGFEKRVHFARIGVSVYPTPGVFAVASMVIPAFAGSRAAVLQTLTIQFTHWYILHNFY